MAQILPLKAKKMVLLNFHCFRAFVPVMTSIFWATWFASVTSSSAFVHRLDKCEPINIPRCRVMPYNMTRMPNLLHHNTQENARLAFEQFHVLLDQNCADVLLFFLCAMYVPICTVAFQPQPIPPCRGVCEKTRAGCEPLMNAYNVSWPESLSCSKLPWYERGVCVSPEAIVTPISDVVVSKRCTCKKKTRRLTSMFRNKQYDYAVRAVIIRRKKVDDKTITIKVQVEEVLFCGQVKFPRSNHVTLWTNSSCGCPRLRQGRHYLLAGHEDVITGRLLLIPSTALAIGWRDKWGFQVKQWHHQKTTAELTSEKEPKISTTVSAQKTNFQNSKTNATSKLKSGGRKSKPNSISTQKSSSNQNSKKGVERKHSPRQQPWQKQNVSKHRSSKLIITHPNSNLTRR